MLMASMLILDLSSDWTSNLGFPNPSFSRRIQMLYTLAVILLIAWLLGVVGTYTIGAFVHVLLVVAVVLFLVGLISGRETIA
jgi:hypothetical protein